MRGKMDKPRAGLEISESKWRDFVKQWALYKRTTRITGQDVADDLWQCLSDPLRMEVTSEQGANIENGLKADLLKAIKRMAVLESNLMVQRNNMRQLVLERVRRLGTFWIA